jgi:ribonuclease J
MHSTVLNERKRLARDGVVAVFVTVSKRTGEVLVPPEVLSSGFLEIDESQELFEKTSKLVVTSLEQAGLHVLELDEVRSRVRDAVSSFLHKETRRRPTVLAVIEQV